MPSPIGMGRHLMGVLRHDRPNLAEKVSFRCGFWRPNCWNCVDEKGRLGGNRGLMGSVVLRMVERRGGGRRGGILAIVFS